MDLDLYENGFSLKSRRKQTFDKNEIVDDSFVRIKEKPESAEDMSYYFEDFTEDVLDALLEENLEPADEVTQAEIESTLDLIRSKHPNEFGDKKFKRTYCLTSRRRGRPTLKPFDIQEITQKTAAFFVKRVASLRDVSAGIEGGCDLSDETANSSDLVVVRNMLEKTRRVCIPRTEELCFVPEITDGLPLNAARRNSAVLLDNSEVMIRACGGFRLFARTFSDATLAKCFKHPLFDTIKERGVPRHLRYVHILRNVWLNLPEDERYDWQRLCIALSESPELANFCDFHLKIDECIEPMDLTKSELASRIWIQSIEPDKLPCPLCASNLAKRYTMSDLLAHLSQSHHSIHLYTCHFCSRAFLCSELLMSHECEQFAEYLSEIEPCEDTKFAFNYVYVSLICAECGFHLILSPRCEEDSFTSSFINCLFAHNSNSFIIFLVYSADELTQSNVRLGFHRIFPGADLNCRFCLKSDKLVEGAVLSSKTKQSNHKTFNNVFELDKHLRMYHKKEISPMKCSRCPASFFNSDVYKDHILSHIQELSLVTLFLDAAPIFPPLLERHNPIIRVAHHINFEKFDSYDFVKKEPDNIEENYVLEDETSNENGNANIRRSNRKRKATTTLQIAQKQKLKRSKQQRTWEDYCRMLHSLNEITDLAWLKSHSEISLPVVFDGRTIVGNTVNGLVLDDNIFECKKCNAVLIGNSLTLDHLKKCYSKEFLTVDDDFKDYAYFLFDVKNKFPFARVKCARCATTHCSILALAKHSALTHSVLLRIHKNNSTIQEAADMIFKKQWVRTKYDDFLANEIETAQKMRSACKSEFDEQVAEEDDDGYVEYLRRLPSPTPESAFSTAFKHNIRRNSSASSVAMDENVAQNCRDSTPLSTTAKNFEDEAFIKCEVDDNYGMDDQIVSDVSQQNLTNKETTITQGYIDNYIGNTSENEECGDNDTTDSFFDDFATTSVTSGRASMSASASTSIPNGHRLWSVNPYKPRPTVQRRYTCFLCYRSLNEITTLNEHYEEHPEQWSRCPLCVRDGRWQACKFRPFDGLIDFFRHMREEHVRIENLLVECTFCKVSVSSSSSLLHGISSIIRHIVYDCVSSGVCFLCDDWRPSTSVLKRPSENDFATQLKEHRRKDHALIYDRFICSACLKGFYSQDLFLRHECEHSIRCCCNPNRIFNNNDAFYAHIDESALKDKSHKAMPSRIEFVNKNRPFVKNEEYERFCKQKIVERARLKKNSDDFFTCRAGGIAAQRRRPFVLASKPSQENLVKFSLFMKTDFGKSVVADFGRDVMSDIYDVVQSMIGCVADSFESQTSKAIERNSSHGNNSQYPSSSVLASVLGNESVASSISAVPRPVSMIISQDGLKCEYCPFMTNSLSELLKHRKQRHNNNKEYGIPYDFELYLCRSCCYAFNKIVEYERHMESHALPIACKQCSCVSGRDSEFLDHRQNHHSRSGIYACTVCSIMYTIEAAFMLHMVQKHRMRLAYFCKTCGICSTNLGKIFVHITSDSCRKLLTIDFIGFVDASQIQFLPNSMDWLQHVMNDASKPLELAKLNSCRHNRCLNARSEPLVSCLKCNCLTTLRDFKNRSGNSKAKLNFELAKDNDRLDLQKILQEFAKCQRKDFFLTDNRRSADDAFIFALEESRLENSQQQRRQRPNSSTLSLVEKSTFSSLPKKGTREVPKSIINGVIRPQIRTITKIPAKPVNELRGAPHVADKIQKTSSRPKSVGLRHEIKTEELCELDDVLPSSIGTSKVSQNTNGIKHIVSKKRTEENRNLFIDEQNDDIESSKKNSHPLVKEEPMDFVESVDSSTITVKNTFNALAKDIVSDKGRATDDDLKIIGEVKPKTFIRRPLNAITKPTFRSSGNSFVQSGVDSVRRLTTPSTSGFPLKMRPGSASNISKIGRDFSIQQATAAPAGAPVASKQYMIRYNITAAPRRDGSDVEKRNEQSPTGTADISALSSLKEQMDNQLLQIKQEPELSNSNNSSNAIRIQEAKTSEQIVVAACKNKIVPLGKSRRVYPNAPINVVPKSFSPASRAFSTQPKHRLATANKEREDAYDNNAGEDEDVLLLPSRPLSTTRGSQSLSLFQRSSFTAKVPYNNISGGVGARNRKMCGAPLYDKVVSPFLSWRRQTRALLDDNHVLADRVRHMRSQLDCERYMCVVCKAVHVKQSDAVLHQFHEHRVNGVRYSLQCPVCRIVFSDLTLFYAHMVTDKRHVMLKHKSDWCNFSFCEEREAIRHNNEHSAAAEALNMPCGVNCCGICGTAKDYWFASLDGRTFIDHTVFHGFRSAVICRPCGAHFPDENFACEHFSKKHVNFSEHASGSALKNHTTPKKVCRLCCVYLTDEEILDHFEQKHKFTFIEFVSELDNELVISASTELRRRFNI